LEGIVPYERPGHCAASDFATTQQDSNIPQCIPLKEIKVKKIILGIAVAAPLIAAASSSPDSSFYKNAAEGGIAEVEIGQLAEKKAVDPSVNSFAAMMIKDHTAANAKLQSIASSKSIDLPARAGIGGMATKTKLEVLSGETFDKSYIKSMIKDHQDTIALFKKEAAEGQDTDAKAFAAATLPTLQTHLNAIESIAKAKGVDSN
jgi:putative membrane protein